MSQSWQFQYFAGRLNRLEELLIEIIKKEKVIMAQIDDLQTAINTLDADTQALVAEQTKAFADLEAAVKAGGTGPDLTPIIARLQTNHAALVQALADAQAADNTTQPPTPPVTPPAGS